MPKLPKGVTLKGLPKRGESPVAAKSPTGPKYTPPQKIPRMKIEGTEEQLDIWEAMDSGNKKHILVHALAGVGKTATAVEGLFRDSLPNKFNTMRAMAVFGRANGKEIQQKVPEGVRAGTLHSLMFGLVRQCLALPSGNRAVNENKVRTLLDEVIQGRRLPRGSNWAVYKLVDLAKNTGISERELEEPGEFLQDLIIRYGVSSRLPERELIDLTGKVLRLSTDGDYTKSLGIDFSDMIWLPYVMDLRPRRKFDTLILDEAQDLSVVQQHDAISMGSRIIAIGDENQAIYGFRGAADDSIPLLESKLGTMQHYPLTICWRCPQEVIRLAQSLVPAIRSREGAEQGEVREITPDDITEQVKPGDMVLCRTNAPLVPLVFRLWSKSVRAYIQGRKFGQDLMDLVTTEEYYGITLDELVQRLRDRMFQEESRLLNIPNSDATIAYLHDRYDCLFSLAQHSTLDGTDGVKQLKDRLSFLFTDVDDKEKVRLSTAHRCVHPNTLVETPNGLVRIENIESKGTVGTPYGIAKYSGKFVRSKERMLRLQTKKGYTLTITKDHRMTVWVNGVGESSKRGSDLEKGDLLRLFIGNRLDRTDEPELHGPPTHDSRATPCSYPRRVTREFAELLGILVADGTIFRSGLRVVKRDKDVVSRVSDLVRIVFGHPARIKDHDGTPCAEFSSTEVSRWLLGINGLAPKQKDVPDIILRSRVECQCRFLRGLFEDGTVNLKDGVVDHIHLDQHVPELLEIAQTMLLRLGIVSSLRRRRPQDGMSTLYIYGVYTKIFHEKIGFISSFKNNRLNLSCGKEDNSIIPILQDELHGCRNLLRKYEYDNARARGYVSRTGMKKILERVDKPIWRDRMDWLYEPIETLSQVISPSLCIDVPDGHRFLQNGFDGWNSKGLEADNVYVIEPHLFPHPMARQDWEKKGERNLLYVTITRARKTLSFVGQIPLMAKTPQLNDEEEPQDDED